MDTYVVLHKKIVRINPDGDDEVFEVGDQIEPTEAELRAFGDKLRKADAPRDEAPVPRADVPVAAPGAVQPDKPTTRRS